MANRWPGGLIRKTPVTPTAAAAPGIWTLAEAAYWTKQGTWPGVVVPDPYWSYVSFLLGTTSTNGAQNNTFLDGSANNFTITRFGNTAQGSLSPYGPDWSNYFDGNGDYLTTPANAAFNFGTGDFTAEFWMYKTSSTSFQRLLAYGGFTATGNFQVEFTDDVTATIHINGGFITTTVPNVLNKWVHVAVTRQSGSVRVFTDGVLRSTNTQSGNVSQTNPFSVGAVFDGSSPYTGYLSNVRINKGTALYTANFTPPTAPLTAVSGTSLLTCQSNRFRDDSTNNFTITKFGEASVTPFSPFSLPAPGYTTTAYGGSGYFDGSGDGLTAPNNAAFNLSNGDFTLECWVYNAEVANSVGYAGIWGGGYILYREGTTYRFYYGGPGGSPLTPSIAAVAGAWTHLAVVRNGTTMTFYVNGVSGGSVNVSTTAISFSGQPFGIGANFETGSPGFPLTGYVAGLRLVKGTAVYTSAFTPPTTPPTAVSGTSILCNFTNAGIFDASMNNDMETAGNAQVSSAQAKYGTTSVFFNGSTDWLSMPNSPTHNFGTGDFTIESWVYQASTPGSQNFVSNYNSPSEG